MALLWGGLSLSAIGDQLYAVALTWIAVAVLGANAGYLSALQALVVLLAVLGLGRWADRWDHRRSMIGADLVRAGFLCVVVVAWLVAGGPQAGWLVAAVVVLALGQAVFQPAMQVVLPGVVPEVRLLPAANALLDATERSARLLGPGLVGMFAGLVPVVHFLTLDALSFTISAAALSLIGRFRPAVERAEAPLGREPIWSAIVRGAVAMRGHPLLGFVLTFKAPAIGTWYAVFYLGLPVMIEQRGVQGPGGSGLGAYGLVISAYGLTNLLSTLVVGGRPLPVRPQFQMFAGNVITGVGIALMGLAAWLPQAWVLPGFAAAAAFGAIGGPMGDIPIAVLRQTRLEAADRAPAMRAYMAAGSLGMLVALLLAPGAMAAFGSVAAVVGCGALLVCVGLAGLVRHAGWREPPHA